MDTYSSMSTNCNSSETAPRPGGIAGTDGYPGLEASHTQDPHLYSDSDRHLHKTSMVESCDEEDTEDDEDEDEDDFENTPVAFNADNSTPANSQPRIHRRISKTDANSIVGGESLEDYDSATGDTNKTKIEATGREDHFDQGEGGKIPNSDPQHKVFSFALPFGGLSNVRSNIAKQLQSFKIESLPLIGNHTDEHHEQMKRDMELMLERQVLIGTFDDATYFKHVKKTDNSRMRAVKKSLTNNLNEFLPQKKDPKRYQLIYNEIEGNIVVMGGYRGLILRDAKTHKRVWIPIKAGFNLRKINLLLGPNMEDELRATDLIYPDGVLANIGPIDICKKLIKKLSNNPKTNVKEFGYDWRLGNDLTSKKLQAFLQDIYDSTGKPTLVIAHSMGGLVAHSALQAKPSLFRLIVYVGVPSECLNILGPLRYTDSVILLDKILTHEVNFMMRSLFSFLPLGGKVFMDLKTHEFYEMDLFDPDVWVEYGLSPLVSKKRAAQEANAKLGTRFGTLSPSTSRLKLPPLHDESSSSSFPSINSLSNRFKHYRSISIKRKTKSQDTMASSPQGPLGPESPDSIDNGGHDAADVTADVAGVSLPSAANVEHEHAEQEHFAISFTQAYNYLSETLKRAKEFILSLDYRPELESQYPPMAIVYGNTVPSVRGSLVNGVQDIKDGNYFGFFYGHGDGVVHQKWLMPERKGFRPYNEETGEGQIVGKFASDTGHVSLMTDFKAMGNALCAVWEAEQQWRK